MGSSLGGNSASVTSNSDAGGTNSLDCSEFSLEAMGSESMDRGPLMGWGVLLG